MNRFFSPSTGQFYSEALHGPRRIEEPLTAREARAGKRPRLIDNPACTMPDDVVEVAEARWAALMEAQNAGKQIVARGGKPVAVDREQAEEDRLAARRWKRNRLLSESDWTQLADATPPGGQAAWAAYRQALRDLDMAGGDWPAAPGA